MGHKQWDIDRAIAKIERGVWFSQAVIARAADCQPKTARRRLDYLVSIGVLIQAEVEYRPNIKQQIFCRGEE